MTNDTDCIEWRGPKNDKGYGLTRKDGKGQFAHRVSYCESNGVSIDSIKGKLVRHACDNPCCVNPKHLLIGTHADNMRDMVERGRQARNRGEKSGSAKLTDAQVAEIRATYIVRSREFGTPSLARKFNVTRGQISHIINNRRRAYPAASAGDQS